MNKSNFTKWLKSNNLKWEENFGQAIYQLAIDHQEKTNSNLSEIWKNLSVSKQNLNEWMKTCNRSETRLNSKRIVLENAVSFFNLTQEEAIELVETSGMFRFPGGKHPKINDEFSRVFNDRLKSWGGKHRVLIDYMGVDKTTFYRIKSGKHIRKETLLALLILIDLDPKDIRYLLNLAGYDLSKSIPLDIVVIYFLDNKEANWSSFKLLGQINDTLCDLELPLLQSRMPNF